MNANDCTPPPAWSTTPPTGPGYFWSRSHGGRPVIAWYTDTGIRMSCDQTVIVLDSDEGRDWMATQAVEFWSEPVVFAGKPKESPTPGTDVATTCPQCGSLEVRIMGFTECGLSSKLSYRAPAATVASRKNNRMTTNTEQTSGVAISSSAVVRPPWDKLCSCVLINCHVSTQRPRETDDGYKMRWQQTVRAAYEDGADWTYDADCTKCNSGEVA